MYLDKVIYWRARFGKFLILARLPSGLYILQPNEPGAFNLLEHIQVCKIYTWPCEIEKNDIVIDCGAHVGIFSLEVARKAQKVIAIEPHPLNYKLLKLNVTLNELNNVITLPVALWEKDHRWLKLYVAETSVSHTIKPNMLGSARYIYVPSMCLDSVLSKCNLDRVDMIKVDVEGAELQVLKGGKEALRLAKYVVIEAHYQRGSTDFNNIIRLLIKFGFKIYLMNNLIYAFKV